MISEILQTLQSNPHSVIPQLIQEAYTNGVSSTYLHREGIIYQLFFQTLSPTNFNSGPPLEQVLIFDNVIVSLQRPAIDRNELSYAKLSQTFIPIVQSTLFSSLQNLCTKALQSVTMRAGIEFTDQCIALLHAKKDSTVTITIITQIAEASFKRILLMTHLGLPSKQRILAISNDPEISLETEAQAMRKFSHPGIVQGGKYIYKHLPVWKKSLLPWSKKKVWSTETLEGLKERYYELGSAEFFRHEKPNSLQKVIERCYIIYDVTLGLSHIHAMTDDPKKAHYAHMDVKLENIFLTLEPDRIHGVIGDLNPVPEGHKADISLVYSAPETINDYLEFESKDASRPHDVWSLGICLLEALYGDSNPFCSRDFYENGIDQRDFTYICLPKLSTTFMSSPFTTPKINKLISSMLLYKPSHRPIMSLVSQQLLICINELSQKL